MQESHAIRGGRFDLAARFLFALCAAGASSFLASGAAAAHAGGGPAMMQQGWPSGRPGHVGRSMRVSPSDVFNVLDYGAAGDNLTDNTPSFARALAAAEVAGGGVVFAPPGLFRFAGNLSIPPGVSLSGSYDVVSTRPHPRAPCTNPLQ